MGSVVKKTWMKALMGAAIIWALGCGGGSLLAPEDAGAGGDDLGRSDARPAPARYAPNRELTSSGGRVVGGPYTLDFQLGHSLAQDPTAGDGTSLEGAAAIKE